MSNIEDYMRKLYIRADSSNDLARALREIPGYHNFPLELDTRFPGSENWFYLQSATDDVRIVVSHIPGQTFATTHNVLSTNENVPNQDHLGYLVPIHQDKLTKLHRAIKQMTHVSGLYSELVAATADMAPQNDER